MYAHPQQKAAHDVATLRREAGRWLKEQRERCGLTQRQLAALVGVKYYTFISQLEVGRGRIPPDRYELWARTLKMETAEFVRNIMRFYDPETYRLLFGSGDREPTVIDLASYRGTGGSSDGNA
jgi:DNA-binding XRE family transcriptional regulator